MHSFEISKMLCIFFVFQRPVLRFRPWVESAYIHRIAALPALLGRRQSEYAVSATVRGTCTGYLSSRYLYPSIYLIITIIIIIDNNNWLQHPHNKGTKGCAPGPAMVN